METIIAVIVGGAISFAGVVITLRWNQKIHEDNLKEERRKKKEEREFFLKQAAFQAASEALARFIAYYVSLPERILPSDGTIPDEFTDLDVAFNGLHFYCGLETIEKTTHLGQILNEALAEAIKAKMPSGFIAGDVKAIDLRISGIEKMNLNIQGEIGAIYQSDQQSPLLVSRYELLAKNFETIEKAHAERVELIKRKYIETEKCRDVVLANLNTIYESARDLLMLARKELCFPVDEERYRAIMDERIESMRRTSGEFFTEIRKQVKERMQ